MSRYTTDPTDAVLSQDNMRELSSRARALTELLELGSNLRDSDRYQVQLAAASIALAIDSELRLVAKKEGRASSPERF